MNASSGFCPALQSMSNAESSPDERHRGTYTTQGATKRGNRLCQVGLHDAEMLSVAATAVGVPYPQEELERLWKIVLLNRKSPVMRSLIRRAVCFADPESITIAEFHDVIPVRPWTLASAEKGFCGRSKPTV